MGGLIQVPNSFDRFRLSPWVLLLVQLYMLQSPLRAPWRPYDLEDASKVGSQLIALECMWQRRIQTQSSGDVARMTQRGLLLQVKYKPTANKLQVDIPLQGRGCNIDPEARPGMLLKQLSLVSTSAELATSFAIGEFDGHLQHQERLQHTSLRFIRYEERLSSSR